MLYKDLPGLTAVIIIGANIGSRAQTLGLQSMYYCTTYAGRRPARRGRILSLHFKTAGSVDRCYTGNSRTHCIKRHVSAEMVDAAGTVKTDHAYPVLLNLLPMGLKGNAALTHVKHHWRESQ